MTVSFVQAAAVRARRIPWLPVLGTPHRILDRTLSGVGVSVGFWALAFSLLPSLLPRTAWLQGLVSGVTVAVGYGLGAGAHALWTYLGIPALRGRVRTVAVTLSVGGGLALATANMWRLVEWQNEIRRQFGMEPTSPMIWPVVLGVMVLVASGLVVLLRTLLALGHRTVRSFGRRLPPRLARVLGVTVVGLLVWGFWTGVVVRGFFAGANAVFAPQDTTGIHGTAPPTSPERSGSAASLSRWADLGAYGRRFVTGGPTVAQLESVNGPGAKEPIRVYAGLLGADTVQGRADLLLAELKRTGAFDRKVLVVATTTGMGFLDRRGVDPVEYLWNGDTAIAGVQYSYLPSWISLLADQEAVVDTSRVVFETVRQYWSTLPADRRPALYLYGLSLGSKGVESILSSVDVVNEPISGAFLVGPTFTNELHNRVTADRDPGTPVRLPVYDAGRTVRFMDAADGPPSAGPWGPTRVLYLQHPTDPVVFFSPDLAFQRPAWLSPDERSPEVSSEMHWFPLVTMWQVLMDLASAGDVPRDHGHMYSSAADLRGWAAVMQPPGWTPEKEARANALMGTR